MHQFMFNICKKAISLVLVLIIGVVLFGCERTEINTLNGLVALFNEDVLDFKLYYIGKQENLLDLEVTYLTSISNIPFNWSHKNTFILINNLDEKLYFELDDLILLKENIETYRYSFYYLGDTHLNLFFESGLLKDEVMDPSSLSFGYVREGDQFLNVIGTWDRTANEIVKTNELILLELILNEFKYQISINS